MQLQEKFQLVEGGSHEEPGAGSITILSSLALLQGGQAFITSTLQSLDTDYR
jgi:hypothetical protein